MKGLKLEPGCRHACVAWLNLLALKSKPPASAWMAPFAGSRATSAASTLGSCMMVQAPFSPACSRMIAPRRMARSGFLSVNARAANLRPSPLTFASSPRRIITFTSRGVASITTAGTRSFTVSRSCSASSTASSTLSPAAGSATNPSGPR